MGAFLFKVEHEAGTSADPPALKAAVPDWRAGDIIALGPGRALRVTETRLKEDADGDPLVCWWSSPPEVRGLDTTIGPS
jgi:hypothetical protein